MNRYLKYSLLIIVISIIGFTIYYFAIKSNKHSEMKMQNEVYTCSMHPEIIRNKPGNCLICGMALVKKITDNQTQNDSLLDNVLQPTDNFIVGNYKTTTPKDTIINSEINLPGIVAYDPNSSINIAARMSGRIERMYVNYKYQKVTKGQKLFDIYSPELLTEQQNFLYLITNDTENQSIIKASKQKLRLYGMTLNQVNALASAKRANPIISIYSPASGIIQGTESMTKNIEGSMQNSNITTEALTIKEGDYIKKSDIVFKLVNIDKVWAVFNVIQGYNSLIKINQPIDITSEFNENEPIIAKINFIETQFSQTDRTSRIRVYLNNSSLKLPIGLRLQGVVKTNSTKANWLEKEALVTIGNKKIVFMKMKDGFKAKEIKTGMEINDFIQIIEGISVEDTIAKNAQFLIDSESFIKTEKP